ncbi:MAG TPA: DUF2252 family protein [Kineosporiaceae bacterium]
MTKDQRGGPRPFDDSSAAFLAWMADHPPVIEPEFAVRAKKIAQDPFTFLRGTFYRWAELFGWYCPELAGAPRILAVGDLHADNFGTWPTDRGLAWGVNDFDEAAPLPYTVDLVRLVTSVLVDDVGLPAGHCAQAVLAGYRPVIRDPRPEPVLLHSDAAKRLREDVERARRPDRHFVERWQEQPVGRGSPEWVDEAVRILRAPPPSSAADGRLYHREAGCGSLGRVRILGYPLEPGRPLAREIKRLLPSSWEWAAAGGPARADHPAEGNPHHRTLVNAARGLVDPSLAVDETARWVSRELSPKRVRVSLADRATGSGERSHHADALLPLMGRAVANVHVATGGAARVDAHLPRHHRWLADAAERMADAVRAEHAAVAADG